LLFEKQFLPFHIAWDTFHQQTRRKKMYKINIKFKCESIFIFFPNVPYHTIATPHILVHTLVLLQVYYISFFRLPRFLQVWEWTHIKKTGAIKSADMDDSSLYRASIIVTHVHIFRWFFFSLFDYWMLPYGGFLDFFFIESGQHPHEIGFYQSGYWSVDDG
jgi:hypothetical protein